MIKNDRKNDAHKRVSDKNTMKIPKNPEHHAVITKKLAEKPRFFLKEEDRILWEAVARSTRPLHPENKPCIMTDDLYLWDIENGLNSPERIRTEPVRASLAQGIGETSLKTRQKQIEPVNPLHDIDRPTIRKIARGRVEIQARIDLHGLRQREAHDLLYSFLADAWHRGLRFVLVITGKGASYGSEGVLKQAVPQWFSTPLFRIYVSAYEDAARHHGGQGALYVRLRKTPAEKLAENHRQLYFKRSMK